jgi:hypothetical protein
LTSDAVWLCVWLAAAAMAVSAVTCWLCLFIRVWAVYRVHHIQPGLYSRLLGLLGVLQGQRFTPEGSPWPSARHIREAGLGCAMHVAPGKVLQVDRP